MDINTIISAYNFQKSQNFGYSPSFIVLHLLHKTKVINQVKQNTQYHFLLPLLMFSCDVDFEAVLCLYNSKSLQP